MNKTIVVDKALCPQNHPCPAVRVCPADAISQASPFSAPEIDEEKCTKCGMCTKACFAFQCHGC